MRAGNRWSTSTELRRRSHHRRHSCACPLALCFCYIARQRAPRLLQVSNTKLASSCHNPCTQPQSMHTASVHPQVEEAQPKQQASVPAPTEECGKDRRNRKRREKRRKGTAVTKAKRKLLLKRNRVNAKNYRDRRSMHQQFQIPRMQKQQQQPIQSNMTTGPDSAAGGFGAQLGAGQQPGLTGTNLYDATTATLRRSASLLALTHIAAVFVVAAFLELVSRTPPRCIRPTLLLL